MVDLQRVLNTGPWSFNGHTLILYHLQPGEDPLLVPLTHVPFWVQVSELPTGFMSIGVGEQLGNYVGRFMEYDANNNLGSWRNYMRIRVLLDVRLPLKRRKKIRMEDGAWAYIEFKYERMGTFCSLCGHMGTPITFVISYSKHNPKSWRGGGVHG